MKRVMFLLFLLCPVLSATGQPYPQMRRADKVRVLEAQSIAARYSEASWPGMAQVPLTLLLLTDSAEFLLHHPNPDNSFTNLGIDPFLKTTVYFRRPQLNKHLLATFPAVNGRNCMVVGTPENTGKTSTAWIVKLLHEYFHLYTYTSPGYYQSVEKLELTGGDNTGMWMLNYPFPYQQPAVVEAYTRYIAGFAEGLEKTSEATLQRYRAARQQLKHTLAPQDYRYLSFQLWQEGIARYSEYRFLEQLQHYQPSEAVQALPDFTPFQAYKQELVKKQLQQLKEQRLPDGERLCFYTAGFAEGLLLDKLNPNWRSRYLTNRFYLEQYTKQPVKTD